MYPPTYSTVSACTTIWLIDRNAPGRHALTNFAVFHASYCTACDCSLHRCTPFMRICFSLHAVYLNQANFCQRWSYCNVGVACLQDVWYSKYADNSRVHFSVASCPSFSVTNAFGVSPHFSCGTPITATSRTASCRLGPSSRPTGPRQGRQHDGNAH